MVFALWDQLLVVLELFDVASTLQGCLCMQKKNREWLTFQYVIKSANLNIR